MSIIDRIDELVNDTRVAKFVDGSMDFIYRNTKGRFRKREEIFEENVINSIIINPFNRKYAESHTKITELTIALSKIKEELNKENLSSLKKLSLYTKLEIAKTEIEKHKIILNTIDLGRKDKTEKIEKELRDNPKFKKKIRAIEKKSRMYADMSNQRKNLLRDLNVLTIRFKDKKNFEKESKNFPQYELPKLESDIDEKSKSYMYLTSEDILKRIKRTKKEITKLELKQSITADRIYELEKEINDVYETGDKIDVKTNKALVKQTGIFSKIRRRCIALLEGLRHWKEDKYNELDNKELEKGNIIEVEELDIGEELEKSRQVTKEEVIEDIKNSDIDNAKKIEELDKKLDLMFQNNIDLEPKVDENSIQQDLKGQEQENENMEIEFLDEFEVKPNEEKDIELEDEKETDIKPQDKTEKDTEFYNKAEIDKKEEKEEQVDEEIETKNKRFTGLKLTALLSTIKNSSKEKKDIIEEAIKSKIKSKPKKDIILEAKSKIKRKSKKDNKKDNELETVKVESPEEKILSKKEIPNLEEQKVIIPPVIKQENVKEEPKKEEKQKEVSSNLENENVIVEPVENVEKQEQVKEETEKQDKVEKERRKEEIKARLEDMEKEEYNAWWTQEHIDLEREYKELNGSETSNPGVNSITQIDIATKDVIVKSHDKDNKEFVEVEPNKPVVNEEVEPNKPVVNEEVELNKPVANEEDRLQAMLDSMKNNNSNVKTGQDRVREAQEAKMSAEELTKVMNDRIQKGLSIEGYEERVQTKRVKEALEKGDIEAAQNSQIKRVAFSNRMKTETQNKEEDKEKVDQELARKVIESLEKMQEDNILEK